MIAQRIKALRRELHMTQTEFGKVIGLSQGHLTSIESGKRNVTERTVATICRVFRVNEAWLREGRGAMFLGGARRHSARPRRELPPGPAGTGGR